MALANRSSHVTVPIQGFQPTIKGVQFALLIALATTWPRLTHGAGQCCCNSLVDDSWTYYRGNLYKFIELKLPFHLAEEYCQGFGGHIATFHSKEDSVFVADEMVDCANTKLDGDPSDTKGHSYIGIFESFDGTGTVFGNNTTTGKPRRWKNVDGTPIIYDGFAAGEPKFYPETPHDNCVRVVNCKQNDQTETFFVGSWNDHRCDIALPFICKRPAFPVFSRDCD